jgi:hypothetical protein
MLSMNNISNFFLLFYAMDCKIIQNINDPGLAALGHGCIGDCCVISVDSKRLQNS